MNTQARPRSDTVFLNVPYDDRFRPLFIAYVASLAAHGLKPRATLELSGSDRRLDRIIELVRGCRYSVHDLSRVEVDSNSPKTPRFNMPFELGLAVGWAKSNPEKHEWLVFESEPHRLAKSLSDLNGTDPHIHGGTTHGVLRAVSNAFSRHSKTPSLEDQNAIRGLLIGTWSQFQKQGRGSLYEAAAFRDFVSAAVGIAERIETVGKPPLE